MQYFHLDTLDKIPEFKLLLSIKDPPRELYGYGDWRADLLENCVAVVGSRKMTNYGRQIIEKLIPQLVIAGKTIVSGFMYGVDQYTHQVCVESGGKTIAVLGWGITRPVENQDRILADQIISSGGLILSEWLDQSAMLWTFPARNRIVAGLSSEVYIVEAAEKSGSLLTANLAYKFKRKLWAVPGPITNRTSVGTNALIKSGIAEMWLGEFNSPLKLLEINDPILNLLQNEWLTANEISRHLNLPVADVGAKLSWFCVTNQIVEREGKYYLNYAS